MENMAKHYIHEIPEGYEARIEGNKVIIDLRESEDEKIRKRIRLCLAECVHKDIIRDYEHDEALAWLEKQKVLTRQPRDWRDADERMSHPLYLEGFDVGRKVGKIEAEQKPAEWSEEDSKRYISIGTTLETSVVLSKEDYDANMAWLRELVNAKKYSGPQPHWKPSEEQMKALQNAVALTACDKELARLYNQLKKQM